MSDGNVRIIELTAADAVEDNDFLAIDNNSTAQSDDDTTAGTRKVRAKDFVQASLTVDETPTEDSENLVTSGGVYDALADVYDNLTSVAVYGASSGSIATFDDGSANPIKELTAQIVAVQDLHGYDAPWVGGSKKNKFGGNYNELFPLHIESGTTVTAYTDVNSSINFYKSDGETRIDYWSVTSSGRSFTLSEDAYYWKFSGASTTPSKMYIAIESSFSGYEPYSNICPISGWDGANVWVQAEVDPTAEADYSISWQTQSGTVYGGNFKLFKDGGKWYITVNSCPYFASYNGETLVGEWISDRDVYAVGTTPTIGAQVVNIGGEVTTTTFEISTEIATLLGNNNIFADCGDVDVEYVKDTDIVIKKLLYKDLTATLSANATSLTITDSAITTDATYDIFTDTYGVSPTAVSVSNGSMTLTFTARSSATKVKVRVML